MTKLKQAQRFLAEPLSSGSSEIDTIDYALKDLMPLLISKDAPERSAKLISKDAPERSAKLISKDAPERSAKLADCLEILLRIKKENQPLLKSSDFEKEISDKILSLQPNDSLLIPGGWANQGEEVEQSMFYEFKKDAQGNLLFCIYNMGDGLSYHEQEEGRYSPVKVYSVSQHALESQSQEVLMNNLSYFISQLLLAQQPNRRLPEALFTTKKLYDAFNTIALLDGQAVSAVEQNVVTKEDYIEPSSTKIPAYFLLYHWLHRPSHDNNDIDSIKLYQFKLKLLSHWIDKLINSGEVHKFQHVINKRIEQFKRRLNLFEEVEQAPILLHLQSLTDKVMHASQNQNPSSKVNLGLNTTYKFKPPTGLPKPNFVEKTQKASSLKSVRQPIIKITEEQQSAKQILDQLIEIRDSYQNLKEAGQHILIFEQLEEAFAALALKDPLMADIKKDEQKVFYEIIEKLSAQYTDVCKELQCEKSIRYTFVPWCIWDTLYRMSLTDKDPNLQKLTTTLALPRGIEIAKRNLHNPFLAANNYKVDAAREQVTERFMKRRSELKKTANKTFDAFQDFPDTPKGQNVINSISSDDAKRIKSSFSNVEEFFSFANGNFDYKQSKVIPGDKYGANPMASLTTDHFFSLTTPKVKVQLNLVDELPDDAKLLSQKKRGIVYINPNTGEYKVYSASLGSGSLCKGKEYTYIAMDKGGDSPTLKQNQIGIYLDENNQLYAKGISDYGGSYTGQILSCSLDAPGHIYCNTLKTRLNSSPKNELSLNDDEIDYILYHTNNKYITANRRPIKFNKEKYQKNRYEYEQSIIKSIDSWAYITTFPFYWQGREDELLPTNFIQLSDHTAETGADYQLKLINELPGNDENRAEKGVIYLSENGEYTIRDLEGYVQRAKLPNSFDTSYLSSKLKDPNFKSSIFKVTEQEGFTPPSNFDSRELYHLRSSPSSQIILTLEYFKTHLNLLYSPRVQSYFEANIFQPGLLINLLRDKPDILENFNQLIEQGVNTFSKGKKITPTALFFVRIAVLLSNYSTDCGISSFYPWLNQEQLSSKIEDYIQQLDDTVADSELCYSLYYYQLMLETERFKNTSTLPSDEAFKRLLKNYFYLNATQPSKDLESRDAQFKRHSVMAHFQEIIAGKLQSGKLQSGEYEKDLLANHLKTILSPVLGHSVEMQQYEWIGNYPEYELTAPTSKAGLVVNLEQGRVYQNGLFTSPIPDDIRYHPVLMRVGIDAKTCFISKDNSIIHIPEPDNLRIKRTAEGLQIQKQWVINGSAKWCTLQYMMEQASIEEIKTLANNETPILTHPDSIGMNNGRLLMPGLPAIFYDEKSIQTWIVEEDNQILLTKNRHLFYLYSNDTFEQLPSDSQKAEVHEWILARDWSKQALKTYIQNFENPQQASRWIRVCKNKDESKVNVHFDRYGLMLSGIKQPNNSIKFTALIKGERWNLIDDKHLELGLRENNLTFEKDNKVICLIPVIETSSNQNDATRRIFEYPVTPEGDLKPMTAAHALYLCEVYLKAGQPEKASMILNDCRDRLGGLIGGEIDELRFLNQILQHEEYSGNPIFTICKIKALLLFIDATASGKTYPSITDGKLDDVPYELQPYHPSRSSELKTTLSGLMQNLQATPGLYNLSDWEYQRVFDYVKTDSIALSSPASRSVLVKEAIDFRLPEEWELQNSIFSNEITGITANNNNRSIRHKNGLTGFEANQFDDVKQNYLSALYGIAIGGIQADKDRLKAKCRQILCANNNISLSEGDEFFVHSYILYRLCCLQGAELAREVTALEKNSNRTLKSMISRLRDYSFSQEDQIVISKFVLEQNIAEKTKERAEDIRFTSRLYSLEAYQNELIDMHERLVPTSSPTDPLEKRLLACNYNVAEQIDKLSKLLQQNEQAIENFLSQHTTKVGVEDLELLLLKLPASGQFLQYRRLTGINNEEVCQQLHELLSDHLAIAVQKQQFERVKSHLKNPEKTPAEIVALLADINAKNLLTEKPANNVYQRRENLLVRELQKQMVERLVEPQTEQSQKGRIVKITMGGGKTKVVLPVWAHEKATGHNLVIVEVPPPLLATNTRDLNATSLAFNQGAHSFQFSRESDCSSAKLNELLKLFNDVIRQKHYLVTTGVSIQSLELKYFELLNAPPPKLSEAEPQEKAVVEAQWEEYNEQIKALNQLLTILRTKGDAIIDEVHLGLLQKQKLNYTVGQPKNVPSALIKHCIGLYAYLDSIVDEAEKSENFGQEIDDLTSRLITDSNSPLYSIVCKLNLPPSDREPLKQYLLNKDDTILGKIKSELTADERTTLAIYKLQLSQLLPHTLKRRLGEHYGFSKSSERNPLERLLAIPYSANNTPNERSRFGNVVESINYTIQSVLLTQLDDAALRVLLEALKKQAKGELGDERIRLADTKTGKEFKNYTGRELDDIHLESMRQNHELFNDLKQNKRFLLMALEHKILPQLQSDTNILHSNSANHVSMYRSCQGITGTPWNYSTFHQGLEFTDVALSKEEDDKIIDQLSRKVYDISSLNYTTSNELGDFLKNLLFAKDNVRAIIDISATFRNVSNIEVARALQNHIPKQIKHILFYDEHNNLCALEVGKDKVIQFDSSNAQEINNRLGSTLEERFTYYDQSHTVGSDIKQGKSAKALVLMDERTHINSFLQGCLRMRELINGDQTIDIVVPSALESKLNPENKFEQLTHMMQENQAKELSRGALAAVFANMTDAVRSDILDMILTIENVEEKIALTALFESYIIENKDLNLDHFFEHYGSINVWRKTDALLNEHKNTLLSHWAHLVDQSNVQVQKKEERKSNLKKTLNTIIEKMKGYCPEEQLSQTMRQGETVEVKKEVLQEEEKELQEFHLAKSINADFQEGNYTSWEKKAKDANVSLSTLIFSDKTTKTLQEMCSVVPEQILFDNNIFVSKNFYRTFVTPKESTDEIHTSEPVETLEMKQRDMLAQSLKPVHALLFVEAEGKFQCVLLSGQELNELTPMIRAYQGNDKIWISTSEGALLQAPVSQNYNKLPQSTLKNPEYLRIIEQVRFFKGDIKNMLKDDQDIENSWFAEDKNSKVKFYDTILAPVRTPELTLESLLDRRQDKKYETNPIPAAADPAASKQSPSAQESQTPEEATSPSPEETVSSSGEANLAIHQLKEFLTPEFLNHIEALKKYSQWSDLTNESQDSDEEIKRLYKFCLVKAFMEQKNILQTFVNNVLYDLNKINHPLFVMRTQINEVQTISTGITNTWCKENLNELSQSFREVKHINELKEFLTADFLNQMETLKEFPQWKDLLQESTSVNEELDRLYKIRFLKIFIEKPNAPTDLNRFAEETMFDISIDQRNYYIKWCHENLMGLSESLNQARQTKAQQPSPQEASTPNTQDALKDYVRQLKIFLTPEFLKQVETLKHDPQWSDLANEKPKSGDEINRLYQLYLIKIFISRTPLNPSKQDITNFTLEVIKKEEVKDVRFAKLQKTLKDQDILQGNKYLINWCNTNLITLSESLNQTQQPSPQEASTPNTKDALKDYVKQLKIFLTPEYLKQIETLKGDPKWSELVNENQDFAEEIERLYKLYLTKIFINRTPLNPSKQDITNFIVEVIQKEEVKDVLFAKLQKTLKDQSILNGKKYFINWCNTNLITLSESLNQTQQAKAQQPKPEAFTQNTQDVSKDATNQINSSIDFALAKVRLIVSPLTGRGLIEIKALENLKLLFERLPPEQLQRDLRTIQTTMALIKAICKQVDINLQQQGTVNFKDRLYEIKGDTAPISLLKEHFDILAKKNPQHSHLEQILHLIESFSECKHEASVSRNGF